MHPLLRRKTAADQDLVEILDNYDKQGFVNWVASHRNEGYGGGVLDDTVVDMDVPVFIRLLKECAPDLAKLIQKGNHGWYNVPYPMCPSLVQHDLDTLYPHSVMEHWPVEVLCDEYFGICYSLGRLTKRFDPGTKEMLLKKIREAFPSPAGMMGSRSPQLVNGFDVVGAQAFTDLFGDEAMRQWWMSIPEEDLEAFANGGNVPRGYLLEEFQNRWPREFEELDIQDLM